MMPPATKTAEATAAAENNFNGHSAPTNNSINGSKDTPSKPSSSKTQSSFFYLVHLLLLSIPFLSGSAAGFLWLLGYFWRTQFTPLLERLKLGEYDETHDVYVEFQNDWTYYNRQCGATELLEVQPESADDLMITPTMTGADAAHVMLQYGAITFQNVLTNDTAAELRRYLATLHDIKHELPYTEVFFNSIDRWSLGLGLDDHPAIGKALREVGRHATLQTALEGILGPNPAIIEISTLTSMNGAEPQGIHTDSDWFGSSLGYSRTFLHTYSMFIALQDTTDVMGATTICPGSHYCANQDLERVCLGGREDEEDEDEDDDPNEDVQHKIAFEVSTNGHIGSEGLFKRGDAFLFHQNIWHRGPANEDPDGTDRTMLILTFASRRNSPEKRSMSTQQQQHTTNSHNNGDVRRQPLGTYYYQRWNLWSSSFYDLQHAGISTLVQPWAALRALGLWTWDASWISSYLSSNNNRRNGNNTPYHGAQTIWAETVTYLEQVAQQMANVEDFYDRGELKDFQKHLHRFYYPHIPKWMRGNARQGWVYFLQDTLKKWQWVAFWLNMGVVFGYVLLMTGSGASSLLPAARQLAQVYGLLIMVFWMVLPQYWLNQSALARAIESRQLQKTPFPLSNRNNHQADKAGAVAASELMSFEKDLGPTTLPHRQDILLGTRFDAKFLAAYNHFLDYHPGNRLWLQKVKDWAALPTLDLRRQAMKANIPTDLIHRGIRSRMLKQNPHGMFCQDKSSSKKP